MDENERLVLVFVWGQTGLLMLGLGYLTRYRGWHGLCTGFRPERFKDPEGMGRWIGGHLLLLGGLHLVAAAVVLLAPARTFVWLWALLATTLIFLGIMFVGRRRYLQ